MISLKRNQRGVSLIEVLVSLMLLAIAALGYSSLQGQSLKLTDESLTRTQSINLLRSAAEKIRINGVQSVYSVTVSSGGSNTTTSSSILDKYKALFSQATIINPSCSNGCSPEKQAEKDVIELKAAADELGVKLGMAVCPGTAGQAKTHCLIAAWNTTDATAGSGSNDCMNSSTGKYNSSSDCIYMEAY